MACFYEACTRLLIAKAYYSFSQGALVRGRNQNRRFAKLLARARYL
jgi:hypothetical protein